MTTEHTGQENKRATMKDVARRAGVTIGTVSHVINGTAPISEETTARVREAIRALNYVPNLAARHMRRKEKRQIGLLIPKLDNNFYARIASVLMEDADQEDYTVLMLSYEYSSDKEKRGLVNMVQKTRRPSSSSTAKTTKAASADWSRAASTSFWPTAAAPSPAPPTSLTTTIRCCSRRSPF